jgi:hypothetical protein
VTLTTNASRAANRVLNGLGLQVVRAATIQRLVAAEGAANSRIAAADSRLAAAERAADDFRRSVEDRAEAELRRNSNAHAFRLTPQPGEPTEAVPRAYLDTLLRESLALRDQSGEIARLRRELAAATAGAAGTAGPARGAPGAAEGELYTPVFDYDGLRNDPGIIHNHDFMRNPRFVRAYQRGVAAAGVDYKYFWRAHVALWCASVALSLEGDFVECGVWKGLLSTTIMAYFDWSAVGRKFFLFDTFRGVDERQLTEEEIVKGTIAHFREMYKEDLYDGVVKNFAEFRNVEIVKGSVPETLSTVSIDKVSYLSIDMNNATPEIAAANHFWDRLAPGAPILLDDYGFVNYEVQKRAFDAWAVERGIQILALPTGQGLMIKPGGAKR